MNISTHIFKGYKLKAFILMIRNLKDLCILFLLLASSFSVLAESTFVAADKSVIKQVELFEFDSQEQQRSAVALAKSLRCPQCQNQNLIESNSPIAKDLRLKVFMMIKEGKSDQYVIDYMTDRFGDFVLYKPSFNSNTILLWLLPIFMFLGFMLLAYKSVNKTRKN